MGSNHIRSVAPIRGTAEKHTCDYLLMVARAQRTMTKTAVTLVFIGAAAVATPSQANAWPKADDANCMVAPYMADCAGQPLGTPTSPSDPSCAFAPADAVCGGGPYSAPTSPPPIGSGLPGAMSADGMPYGAPPPPPPTISMPGSIPGMP